MKSPWFVGDFPVTQGYKPGPSDPFDPGHTGIDIGMPQGTPLITPIAGTVTDRENPGGFGHYQTVVPDAAPSTTFILGHESNWDVKSGHYPGGTRVGESGMTGHATGPHLHFEQDVGGPPYAAGNEQDPSQALAGGLDYMQQNGASTGNVTPAAKPTNPYAWYDPRWLIWNEQTAAGVIVADAKAGGLNPTNPLDTAAQVEGWLQSIFSPEHLLRTALIVGGIILLVVGIIVMARVPEKAAAVAPLAAAVA